MFHCYSLSTVLLLLQSPVVTSSHLKSPVISQAWTTTEEMDRLTEPDLAAKEAKKVDVAGGLGEKRIDVVWRKLREQFIVT